MGRGRKGTGVEIKDGGIRIRFTWRGQRCREPLGLKPTSPNLRHAERLAAEIKEKIRLGSFVYADYFAESKRAQKDPPPVAKEVSFHDYATR
ncbi:MAG: DUF3596 domain-containing protein, partial [Rhodospirillales bacterium]